MGVMARIAALAARRPSVAAALPPRGRSSMEPGATLAGAVTALSSHYGSVRPYSSEVLAVLEHLAVYSPVVGQAVHLVTSTANTGHELVLDGPARQLARARDLLGDLAARLYTHSAGADGLVNQYLRQLAVAGAISSEDVLEPDLSALRRVVLVPVGQIELRWEGDAWRPYQRVGDGTVPLNAVTYAYYALETLDGHPPYGLPPFVAAIEPEALQREVLGQLKRYARKIGLYGILSIKVPPPRRRPGEGEAEYGQRCQEMLDKAWEAYKQSYSDGVMVLPGGEQGHDFEHKDIAKSAGNVGEILQGVEMMLMSALNIDPAMFGRSYSTTETYAGVVYGLLLRWAAQFQRLVKRRLERTYRLALLLAGLGDVAVSLRWIPQPELRPEEAAQAEQIRTQTVLDKAGAGIIDPDQAARELGYERAADPERLAGQPQAAGMGRLALVSDNRGGYQPSHLGRLSPPGDEGDEDIRAERGVQAEAERLAGEYRSRVTPVADQIRAAAVAEVERLLAASQGMDAEQFVDEVLASLVRSYGQGWAGETARRVIRETVDPLYRHYRQLSDLVGAGRREWTWGGPERRVLDFAVDADQFYFGKYIDNPEVRRRAMRVLREQYLERGAALFGDGAADAVAAFRRALDQELRSLGDVQIQRIVDTSVQRLRCWAGVQQLQEAGARWAQIWAVLDARTSEICREMHGRIVPVDQAAAEVERLAGLTPEKFDQHLRSNRPEVDAVRLEGTGVLARKRCLLPPYHPRCRTRLKMALSPPPAGDPPESINRAQQRAWRYWQELPPEARRMRLRDAQQGEFHNDRLLRSHAHAHPEVAADVIGYRRALAGVLADPERVLVRLDAAGGLQLGLGRGGEDEWRLTIVDLDSRTPNGVARVRTLYGPPAERPHPWGEKLHRLASGGWVEVMS